MSYVDHLGGSPLRPEAARAMREAASAGNPSSLHALGRAGRRILDGAADAVRALVGTCDADVVMTSGLDESNQLALIGLARAEESRRRAGGIATSLGELTAATALVFARYADEASGALTDLAPLVARAAELGVPVHLDASAAAGRVPLFFDELGVTSLALGAHHLGGPRGVGALVLTRDRPLVPLWRGGGQEKGLRSGSQPTVLLAGFEVAARAALADGHRELAELGQLLERAWQGEVLDAERPRLPGVVTLTGLPHVVRDLADALAADGVVARLVNSDRGAGLRLSLGWSTTRVEIQALASRLSSLREELRRAA